MNRIIKIGMDVHSNSFSLCALESLFGEDDRILAEVKVPAESRYIVQFIENLKKKLGSSGKYSIECGYEAGCLGYSLYHQLTAKDVKCVIPAPTTMLTQKGKRVKTDKRDAYLIAQCLANGGYHAVHIPTEEDNEIKEYIRMRDDAVEARKKVTQQIGSFCIRHGYVYPKTKWTNVHLNWLRGLELSDGLWETLDEYLARYQHLCESIERYGRRIEEFAESSSHREEVKHLKCLKGVLTNTALAVIVETGDFFRFAKGDAYSVYLGLVPGEESSGDHVCRTGISKAGNSHVRKLLVEASQGICRGAIGYKSKALKARQAGNPQEIIDYADRAAIRLLSRYYHLIRAGKKRNVAVTAVARELACFIWGMMTGNIGPRKAGS